MATDLTVRIFDNFYNLDLVVNASEYEVVLAYFEGTMNDIDIAKNFTETLFRISNITQISVLDLLQSFQTGQATKMQVMMTMAYYLNSLNNKTLMYGVTNVVSPNQIVSRNIIHTGPAVTS